MLNIYNIYINMLSKKININKNKREREREITKEGGGLWQAREREIVITRKNRR